MVLVSVIERGIPASALGEITCTGEAGYTQGEVAFRQIDDIPATVSVGGLHLFSETPAWTDWQKVPLNF